jgi:5-methylthioadenosine/S-adenosylhomocysteine deaminase
MSDRQDNPSDKQPTHADLRIDAGWVVPVEPAGAVLRAHSLLLRDGLIAALLPTAQAGQWQCAETLALPDHALLPGLVNTHGHAAMSLLRGYADDLPLMPWLQEHIWPAEAAHVSRGFVRDGTQLAMAEMLRAGTTTFSDMYFFPEVVASLAQGAGMRCQLSFPVFDFPTAWGSGADEYISKGLALRDDCKSRDLVNVAFGPHAPYTVGPASLEKVATYAAELDMAIQIHLHETEGEVLQAVEANGERPIDTLRRIGLLGPRTQCVHMTDLGAQDIASLAETGAHVVHCPQSNMKLASGACPVTALRAAGVNVALGTDGAASNNDLNLFNEMHSAALLGKLRERRRIGAAGTGGPGDGDPGRRARPGPGGTDRQPGRGKAGGRDRRRPVGPVDATALPPDLAARVCRQRRRGHAQLDRRDARSCTSAA